MFMLAAAAQGEIAVFEKVSLAASSVFRRRTGDSPAKPPSGRMAVARAVQRCRLFNTEYNWGNKNILENNTTMW